MAILGEREKRDRRHPDLAFNSYQRGVCIDTFSTNDPVWLIQSFQALYDTEWVENMWSYTMPELVDPTIGDEW